jgi:hypothetical protein
MAFGTVSLIPQNIEPIFWVVIFVFCALVIAKVCTGKYFLHGFLVSIFNCIWIVAVHVLYYKNYIAHHPDMASMAEKMPAQLSIHPRLSMIVVGPIFGIVSGIILGLFSFIASKIVKKN